MSESERECSTCRYARDICGGGFDLVCCRHAPRPIPEAEDSHLSFFDWPSVHRDDWCGEHAWKAEKVCE